MEDFGLEVDFLGGGEDEINEKKENQKKHQDKDFSNDIQEQFSMQLDFENEEELQKAYEELTNNGYTCRILAF